MSKLTLSFKGKVLKVFPLAEGEIAIGSDPACELFIDSLAVHPRHSLVVTRAGKSVLSDLGSPEGTYVNDKRIAGDHPLKDDDVVRIGKHTLLFTEEAVAPRTDSGPAVFDEEVARPSARNGWLQIINGQNVGKTIGLNRNMVNIGKPGVQTAVIVRRNDGYFISHLEGERHPLVNGKDIGEHSRLLQDGDVIQMGNVKLQFYLQ